MEELIEGVNAKKCSRCGHVKLLSNFTTKTGRYMGVRSECKVCEKTHRDKTFEQRSLKSKERYETNKDKILESQKKYYQDNKEVINARNKKYAENNSERLKEKYKEWYAENRDEISSKQKLYYENNKEHTLARVKEYTAVNKEKIKGYLKEYGKKYNKNNRPSITARTAKYRAAKKSRTPCWLTEKDLQDIEDFYALAKALGEVTGTVYHVDHIIPLQGEIVSGFHCPSNLQILTAEENTSKNNKFNIEEFNSGNS